MNNYNFEDRLWEARLRPHRIRLYHNENPYFERYLSPDKPIYGHQFSPGYCLCLLWESQKYQGKFWMVPNILLKPAKQAQDIDKFAEEHRLALISSEQIADIQPQNINKQDNTQTLGWSFSKYHNVLLEKLIILGAGASYDTGNSKHPEGIPMTNYLFDENSNPFLKEFPSLEILKALLSATGDLEEAYELLWQEIIESYNPQNLRALIEARFYLSALMRHYSNKIGTKHYNYLNLMKLINKMSVPRHKEYDKERIIPIVITFNYDTLFEQAAQNWFTTKFTDFEDYAPFPKNSLSVDSDYNFLLFKPHGSCNWFVNAPTPFDTETLQEQVKEKMNKKDDLIIEWLVEFTKTARSYIPRRKGINLKQFLATINPWSGYKFCAPKEFIKEYRHLPVNTFPYPFLLTPFKSKDKFTMPYELRNAMQSALGHFSREGKEIIVIGWKGNEKHFWDLMKLKLGSSTGKVKNIKVITITGNDNSAAEQFKKRGFQVTNFYDVDPEKEGTFSSYIKYCIKNPNGEHNYFKTQNKKTYDHN